MTASQLNRTLLASAIAGLFAAASLTASANLAPRFTDANGDLVADAPTDESRWIDPATLVFSYTPVEFPDVYADICADLLEHMDEFSGNLAKYLPVHSNAAALGAMRSGP